MTNQDEPDRVLTSPDVANLANKIIHSISGSPVANVIAALSLCIRVAAKEGNVPEAEVKQLVDFGRAVFENSRVEKPS